MYLIGMLVLLFLANIAMLMGMTNWPQATREGFAADLVKGKAKIVSGTHMEQFANKKYGSGVAEHFANKKMLSGSQMEQFANMEKKMLSGSQMEQFANPSPALAQGAKHVNTKKAGAGVVEPFMDNLTAGFATAPIGSWDGRNMAAGLPPAAQGFRANHPDEPLAGPPVEIGPDNLFYFKNNQCKPECCGATLSCDGGCVCSTPGQRDFINTRGGNRLRGDF
jgi:hypothetical protein